MSLEQQQSIRARDVEPPRVMDLRFRRPAARSQRDLVAASLLLCPGGKDVDARGRG
jgi:hypothetical protein